MKFTLGRRSKFAEHQVNVAELDHRGGRVGCALVVLAVPPGTAVPRIRALHHPPFAHGCEARAAFGTGLHLDPPAGSIFCQPRVEGMIVILVIAKDRLQAGKLLQTDLREQIRSGGAVVNLALVIRTANSKPRVSTSKCRLRPLIFLPPS